MRVSLSRLSAGILVSSLVGTSAFAAVFPDVTDSHLYQDPIESLVEAGVISGNPDGNFYPERTVNRAEMLKMLYLAAGITPDKGSTDCFSDVQKGSWYEQFVCDAAERGFVEGYSNGTFRPADPVNRVEALKMVQEVFGIELTDSDLNIPLFNDISVTAWYMKYLKNAYSHGILPIAGSSSLSFTPSAPLMRGEAAAMIFNAYSTLSADVEADVSQPTSSSSSSSTSSAASDPNILEVEYPLSAGGKFEDKKPFSYRFDIDAQTVIDIDVALNANQSGTINCTLFLVKSNGFSDQYFVGLQEEKHCYILATLAPGAYQLQLQPSVDDAMYTVAAKTGTSDGNDGFSQAVGLSNVVLTQSLVENNLQNWYTFKVTATNGKHMKVVVSNTANVDCLIYPMSDVDLYGFAGPECNEDYTFPPGTYYVSVHRTGARGVPQTYSVRLED